MNHDKLKDYILSAYRYEKRNGENLLMSDYEWDMLGNQLQKGWDTFESPLKKFCEPALLGVTASCGAINFEGIQAEFPDVLS